MEESCSKPVSLNLPGGVEERIESDCVVVEKGQCVTNAAACPVDSKPVTSLVSYQTT